MNERAMDDVEKLTLLTVKLRAAVKTLEQMGFSHCGGELWKPPLGPKPGFLDWTGEGLPPVGTVCEIYIDKTATWVKSTVVAHVVLRGVSHAIAHDGESCFYGIASDFRPMRTVEQIAAEEHERQIVAIEDAIFTALDVCAPYEDRRRKVAEMVVAAGFVRGEKK